MMLELNHFYNMDCMEGMKQFPDKYFELAIVDPPYGINATKMKMGNRQTVKPDNSKRWDNHPPDKAYFDELFRVSRNQVIWGGGNTSAFRRRDACLSGTKENQCTVVAFLSLK